MGADAALSQGWSPKVIVAAAAAFWFVLVVPVAAWWEARRQRSRSQRIVPPFGPKEER